MLTRREFLISALTVAVAGCAGKKIEEINNQVTPLPSLIPTPETTASLTEKEIMDKTGENFLKILDQMSQHQEKNISFLPSLLYDFQNNGLGEFFVSKPKFSQNNSLKATTDIPLICSYKENGNFQIIINTNTFFFDNLLPIEAVATNLDECLNYQTKVSQSYKIFKKDNPLANFSDTLKENPNWLEEALVEAWFTTTQKIVVPNRNKMPSGNNIYQLLLQLHDTCKGNFSCWKKSFPKNNSILNSGIVRV